MSMSQCPIDPEGKHASLSDCRPLHSRSLPCSQPHSLPLPLSLSHTHTHTHIHDRSLHIIPHPPAHTHRLVVYTKLTFCQRSWLLLLHIQSPLQYQLSAPVPNAHNPNNNMQQNGIQRCSLRVPTCIQHISPNILHWGQCSRQDLLLLQAVGIQDHPGQLQSPEETAQVRGDGHREGD